MKIETFLLETEGNMPNNDRFPLLYYRGAFETPVSPSEVESHLRDNRWYNSWRNGVFPYHHFHATVHEILVCYGGTARVQFGGAGGPEVDVRESDAVLIPAGVGHKRISAESGFVVIGAYLDGASWDLQRPESSDLAEAKRTISQVGKPPVDPISGDEDGLLSHWQ
jgi:uncharacterized protein YjlB